MNNYEKKILLNKDIKLSYKICDECLEYNEEYQGYFLKISINTKTHIIDNATIDTKDGDKDDKIISKTFCKTIIGLPILEASDHSLIRLENLLRDNDIKHNIKGVIMPSNTLDIFKILLVLIRNIYKQYSKKQNYNPPVNTYRGDINLEWKKLNMNIKEKKIIEIIDVFCKKNNIENYDIKIIRDTRIEFALDKDLYPLLAKLLFDMEVFISRKLGFTLEVMFLEKKDTNKRSKEKNEK